MLLTIKYHNRVKQLNLDKRINLQSLQILLAQLFNLKSRVIGLIDQEGHYHDLQQFIQQLNYTRCNVYTIVTDENQNSNETKFLQTSLKYSQLSDFSNKLLFIDFIYDLEEFQNILGGEQYTCIYLIDEKDSQGLDFISALEPLITNFNNWINFYYSFYNRIQDIYRDLESFPKILWVYKGSKKIVSIQLNNDKKMRQMDDIIQKLVQAKISGCSIRNSNIKNPSYISSQQSPDKKRSKSIRRLVEESQIQNTQQHQQNDVGSRFITRVQAKLVQRAPSRGSDNNDDYRYNTLPQQQSSQIYQNESIISQQDLLFRVVADLEEKEILDVTMARLVKRLLIEENKEIMNVLQQYLQNAINMQQLCEKLNKIVENCTNQQRPTSPFQSLKQTPKPPMQQQQVVQLNQQSNRQMQQIQQDYQTQQQFTLEETKNFVIERNNSNFLPEQFGMLTELWKQNDQILQSLCKDYQNKSQRGESPSLKPIQVYADAKFNELLQQNFKRSEIAMIQEYKNNKSSIYAAFQHFRYVTDLEQFIAGLKKAILNIMSQNQNLNQPEKQQVSSLKSKEITLFKYQSPKAPSPFSVLGPNFSIQDNDALSPQPQSVQNQGQLQKEAILNSEQPIVQNEVQQVKLFQTTPIQNQLQKKEKNEESKQQQQQKQNIQQPIQPAQQQGEIEQNLIPNPEQVQSNKQIMSKSEQISAQKRLPQPSEVTAKDIIFNEEYFAQTKKSQRELYADKVDLFFSIQQEKVLHQTFKDMLWHMGLDEPKMKLVEQLFQENDYQLFEIVQRYQTSRNVGPAKAQLIKLITDPQHQVQDYRKVKMYNLFMNQVRQFTLQTHLQENERNFLLKMFMDNDLQVLGTFETYLQNQDAEDMLENLQMIIKQYSKYTNINSTHDELPQPKQEQLNAKEILAQIKQYFSAEEKNRLDSAANDHRESKIVELFIQYKQDQDLNGFIASIKKLSQQDSNKKYHLSFEELLKKLQKDEQLKIDDFMMSIINQKKNEQRIKGVFELFTFNRNLEDFIESIRSISKLLQQEFIQQTLDSFEKEQLLDENKLISLKEKAHDYHKDYPKLLGAFSLYFEQQLSDPISAKKELIETLQLFRQ